MKYSLCILCISLFLSCSSKKENSQHIKWLQGKWERLNDKPGQNTYEFWNRNTGLGFTLKDGDTIFKEELRIVSRDKKLYLEVVGVNEDPTLFQFTSQTNTSFTCENKENEFPKKITYYIENDSLKAIVSNDDFKIDFVFAKLKD